MNNLADDVGGEKSQVELQLSFQSEKIENLSKNADMLKERLNSILRNEPPEITGEETKQEVLVPMADQLRSHNEQISKISNAIKEIIELCEL